MLNFIKFIALQGYHGPCVMAMQVLTLALVIQQAVAIAERDRLRNAVHLRYSLSIGYETDLTRNLCFGF